MKNLESLLFNKALGKVIRDDLTRPAIPRVKKKLIQPVIYNNYVFSVRNGWFFSDGLYLLCEGIQQDNDFLLIASNGWYCGAVQFAKKIADYYTKSFKCSLDYIMDDMHDGECIQFSVKMTRDDFNNRVLSDSIIEAFIDAFIAKRSDQIIIEEHEDWLENEYYHV